MRFLVLLTLVTPIAADAIGVQAGRETVLTLDWQQQRHHLNLRLGTQLEEISGQYQFKDENFYLAFGAFDVPAKWAALSTRKGRIEWTRHDGRRWRSTWPRSSQSWSDNLTAIAAFHPAPLRGVGFTLAHSRQRDWQTGLLSVSFLPLAGPLQLELLAAGSYHTASTSGPWVYAPGGQPLTVRQHSGARVRFDIETVQIMQSLTNFYGGYYLSNYDYQGQFLFHPPLASPAKLSLAARINFRSRWYQSWAGESPKYQQQIILALRYRHRRQLGVEVQSQFATLGERYRYRRQQEIKLKLVLSPPFWRLSASNSILMTSHPWLDWSFKQRLQLQRQWRPELLTGVWLELRHRRRPGWKVGGQFRLQALDSLRFSVEPSLLIPAAPAAPLLPSLRLKIEQRYAALRGSLQLKLTGAQSGDPAVNSQLVFALVLSLPPGD